MFSMAVHIFKAGLREFGAELHLNDNRNDFHPLCGIGQRGLSEVSPNRLQSHSSRSERKEAKHPNPKPSWRLHFCRLMEPRKVGPRDPSNQDVISVLGKVISKASTCLVTTPLREHTDLQVFSVLQERLEPNL